MFTYSLSGTNLKQGNTARKFNADKSENTKFIFKKIGIQMLYFC